ncbi:MAG TPA: hypothetical protein VGM59_14565 [Dongiaceae bacterium]
MTRLRLILVLVLGAAGFAFLGVPGCSRYADDIDTVKQAESVIPGKSNDLLTLDIAGARGKVEWQGGTSPKYNNDGDIIVVTATIKRISGNGNRHEIQLSFVHNRQTKKVAFDGALVDGKPQTLASGALMLFMMQLE